MSRQVCISKTYKNGKNKLIGGLFHGQGADLKEFIFNKKEFEKLKEVLTEDLKKENKKIVKYTIFINLSACCSGKGEFCSETNSDNGFYLLNSLLEPCFKVANTIL